MTRLVWITMLALADASGLVEASVPGLAHAAVVPVDACRVALDKLSSPDLDSKDPDHEGRRIEKVEGGWQLLNYSKYREMRTPKQEADAERQRKHRATKGSPVSQESVTGRDVSQVSREVSASASASGITVPSVDSVLRGEVVIENSRGEGEQMSLIPVAPRTKEQKAREVVERYMTARHFRLHGSGSRRGMPGEGTMRDLTKRMIERLDDGFSADLLASLPALVEDKAIDFMLKDPAILLRTDNAQGGKCHARRYEAQIAGMELGDRQVAILRNIGALDYVKTMGAKARNWEAGL